MNNKEAREYIKQLLPDYLLKKGINSRKLFRCLNPGHDDKHPSMSLDEKNMQCHCFSCGAKYDIFDLIGIDYDLPSFPDQLNKAADLYGIDIESGSLPDLGQQAQRQPEQKKQTDYSEYIRNCAMRFEESPADEYLKSRGISTQTAAVNLIGYDPEYKSHGNRGTWQAVIIPTGDRMHSYSARNISAEHTGSGTDQRFDKAGSAALFNARAITGSNKSPLFVAEGELDALSIIEAGGEAVGLGSAVNQRLLLKSVEGMPADRLLILCLDNDEAGKKAASELLKKLKEAHSNTVIYNPYGSCKDANEALQADKEAFTDKIRNAEKQIHAERLREYRASASASGMLSGFRDYLLQGLYNRPISTGFPQFDKTLDGGLYSGLYILGAISSLGKTTFCLQIADQIAASGRDVMIFSLEMSAYELIAKSISRNTLLIANEQTGRRDYAKTIRGIMDASRYKQYTDAENDRIGQAMSRYQSYAHHVIIRAEIGKIGVSDIAEAVKKHKEITGAYPVVIIDYLQILKADSDRMTDKQATDSNITALKQLARDMPILAISSMNRESYKVGNKSPANNGRVAVTDLKESGGIDYGADVIIGLQFSSAGDIVKEDKKIISAYDERQAKQEDPRRITAVILKNRNGAVYAEANFHYIPQFNTFYEVK